MEKQVPWEDHNQKIKPQRHYKKGVGRASKQEMMSQGVPILLKPSITSGEKDDRLTALQHMGEARMYALHTQVEHGRGCNLHSNYRSHHNAKM